MTAGTRLSCKRMSTALFYIAFAKCFGSAGLTLLANCPSVNSMRFEQELGAHLIIIERAPGVDPGGVYLRAGADLCDHGAVEGGKIVIGTLLWATTAMPDGSTLRFEFGFQPEGPKGRSVDAVILTHLDRPRTQHRIRVTYDGSGRIETPSDVPNLSLRIL